MGWSGNAVRLGGRTTRKNTRRGRGREDPPRWRVTII